MARRYLGFLVVLFAVCLTFFGCDNSNNRQVNMSFMGPNNLQLYYGSVDQSSAFAPIQINLEKYKIVLDYNKDIIDYDIKSGLITAKKVGTTTLSATCFETTKKIEINVVQAKFCTNLSLSSNVYNLKLEGNKETSPVEVLTNTDYNLPLTYTSSNTEIFSVNDVGIINPINFGTATLKIKAISGVENGEYTYVERSVNINVNSPATEWSIELLDSNKNAMPKVQVEGVLDYYQLFSNVNPATGTRPYYFLKFSSNIPINTLHRQLNTDIVIENLINANQPLWTQNVGEDLTQYFLYANNYLNLFVPIFACDAGTDIISEKCLDVGLNYNNYLTSNSIKIQVNQYPSSFEVEPLQAISSQNEEYTLYLVNEDYRLDADREGFFNQIDLNIGFNTPFSTKKYNVVSNNQNISFSINESILTIQARILGESIITLRSNDCNEIIKNIKIKVCEVPITKMIFKTLSHTTYLNGAIGEEMDLTPQRILPLYSTKAVNYQVINCQIESPLIISSGKVIAQNNGVCTVKIWIQDFSIEYNFIVYNGENFVQLNSLEINVSQDNSFDYYLLGGNGLLLNNQSISIQLYDQNKNAILGDFVQYNISQNQIIFSNGVAGEYYFRILGSVDNCISPFISLKIQ